MSELRQCSSLSLDAMTNEQLTQIFNNQRVLMEALTFLILRDAKGSEEAMGKLKELQTQWIATACQVAAIEPIPKEETPA